jgi:Leucine-rich repeat (LRR) protein
MDAIPTHSPAPPAASTTNPPARLSATQSIHSGFLHKSVPAWLSGASTQRRQALKGVSTTLPAWYQDATPAQRTALTDSFIASVTAQNAVDKSLASFQQVEAFARPLLIKALKDQYQVQVDVDKTQLCLKRPVDVGVLKIELASFEFLKLSMLDAALHNFEAYECEAGAYHETSGFLVATQTADTFESVSIGVTVSQFLGLCRSLDIGKQYQTYLQAFFYPAEAAAEAALRDPFIASQKATMRAAAEQALLQKDIEPADYKMILSVINGEMHPWMGDKQVWFKDLGLMKKRLTGCVAFVICEKYRYTDELLLYIPHDPHHPLKRYTYAQMRSEFKRLLTARDATETTGAAPTRYQQFLSQFLPYDQRPYYFSQFTQEAADSPKDAWQFWRSPWATLIDAISPGSVFTKISEVPPERKVKLEPVADPYIAPSTVGRKGRGLWAANEDLWEYLFTQNRDKALADARSHAVPTADVDTKARDAKLAHLMQVGMLGLNLVSMFVPVLGEVMMVAMAGQLLYESLEGAIEWSEGDRRAAKDHLIDVAENLALIGVMAGVGAGVQKFTAARAVPVIEQLSPVSLPTGETRLWKPDLGAYQSRVSLDASLAPNEAGQYVVDGNTYIRLDGKLYQQRYDQALGKWRIQHPTNADAYQPVLESNGVGAWRFTLERPLAWDRLTLLRRMGQRSEGFSDSELIRAADISGVSDDALRKMHLDHASPPPQLLQAMRMLKADSDAGRVIEQLRGTQPIDDMYLYALPLMTEMPLWPANRVLEVFDGAHLSGKSVKYGGARRVRGSRVRAPIQVSRADILSGELPAFILVALDETEITRLLGEQGARVPESRPGEFARQIADYAQTRQPAIYDSIYKGTEPADPFVKRLQNACIGLTESAALDVLAHASSAELEQLTTTKRAPLRMLEEARWYTRQSRQVRAFAGLRSENIATADSRRLALHTLENLPGWPAGLRLEVREGSLEGSLLDSVGTEADGEKKYLIKKGAQFQAFNDRGEALNSLPRHGDNFYASIMHALPDEARRSLGLPAVGQWAELQQAIIAYADQHQSTALFLLEPQAKSLKPPVRISERVIGYRASGRGAAFNPELVDRLREVYPELTVEQANGFVLQQVRLGKSNGEIFEMVQSRRQEWERLKATLEGWVGPSNTAASDLSGMFQRSQTARALEACWRRAPLAADDQGAARLMIVSYYPLPEIEADFSHVRELTLSGDGMTDIDADAFLSRFPNIVQLTLGERGSAFGTYIGREQSLSNLPSALGAMASLKKLRFRTGAVSLAAGFSQRLAAMTALEDLDLELVRLNAAATPELEFATLQQLKRLKIDAPGMTQWPASVQSLPNLQRLDLSHTAIAAVPSALYVGHEQLWVGLSMDWSKFSHEAFKPAYDYVKNYLGPWGHLVDLDLMVRRYCAGELEFLTGEAGHVNPLPQRIMNLWDTPQTRLAAVEALRLEHAGIFRQFYQPTLSSGLRRATPLPNWSLPPNVRVVRALEKHWRAAVRQRYNVQTDARPSSFFSWTPRVDGNDATVFELLDTAWTQGESAVNELPRLPAGSFSQVQTVRLDRLAVPAEQVRGFLEAFSGAKTLEITACGLTEVPIAPEDFVQLTSLDLSYNRIVVTPAVQRQLSALAQLQHFNAYLNPLVAIDVSALTRLQSLKLASTGLHVWPTGAESLPQLKWLDLRYNSISALPEHVLAHEDVLLRTDLANNAFSPEGRAALTVAQRRIEGVRGLPAGALERFERGSPPFPSVGMPSETAGSLAEYLLPLPRRTPALEGAQGFVSRVQDLNPALSADQATACVTRLRNAGMTEVQIDARLIEWLQASEALIRELNDWIFTREVQINGNRESAFSRQSVAQKIRDCWQDGLTGSGTEAGQTLDFTGLQIGQLPRLETVFRHVRTLNLTGLGFTVDSFNLFCTAFPELTALKLNGNALQLLPDAVKSLSRLERLELSGNRLADALPLQGLVATPRLRSLDLSHNRLDVFDASAFIQLETLDLAHNGLDAWPDGVLELAQLRTLNLTGNDISHFPDRLLGGNHEGLVAGTDLSENTLTLNSLEQLRDYSAANGNRDVMGYTSTTLEQELAQRLVSESESGSDSDSDSDSDADSHGRDTHAVVEADEVIDNPLQDVAAPAMNIWLTYTPSDVRVERSALWLQLAEQVGHESFFHLLSTLPDTAEYRLSGADLTHRVWQVIQAATEDSELRQLLFANAETHGTCGDGRILSFSELETRVYEFNALRDVPLHRPQQRGQALLDLTRRLFRLERVDRLAEAAGKNKDRAEIRLQYRIGMIRGWPDGLELPAQPEHMLYATPIRGQTLLNARASVLADEASELFIDDLISRDYWVRYLRDQHPEVFAELERNATRRQEEVEDAYVQRDDSQEVLDQYLAAMNQLEIETAEARNLKLKELTRTAVAQTPANTTPAGSSSPQPGPSQPRT